MPKKGEFIVSYMKEAMGYEAIPGPAKKSTRDSQEVLSKKTKRKENIMTGRKVKSAQAVIMRRVDTIIPYDDNPRLNERAVNSVANSIKDFGFQVPIIVDADGVIICGHTRLIAAQKLGMTEVPVVVADDLTPEQVRIFRIADNKVGELAEWDKDKLAEEFMNLGNSIDFERYGFKAEEFRSEEELEQEFESSVNDSKEKNGKIMKCPNCGKEFEV